MATGYDIVRSGIAIDALGGRYVWGAKGPVNYDCSGFTFEAGRRNGSALVHGAQNQRDQLRRSNLLISVDQAMRTPGALLWRIDEGPSNDHVAISLGNGSAVEAHSRAKGIGVFSAVGRRWTHGGLFPGINYGGPPPPPKLPPAHPNDLQVIAFLLGVAKTRTYRFGDVDPGVKFVQEGLNRVAGAGLVVDGNFGAATWGAVVNVQKWLHAQDPRVTVDGIVGPQMWKVLWP